jgi:MYXO-CTERM domain-containing protein
VSLFQGPVILDADRTRWSNGVHDWTSLPAPDGGGAPLSQDWNEIETVAPNPTIADLDGDGAAEILFPSYDGRLHAVWLDQTERHGWPIDLNPPGASTIRFASEAVAAELDGDGRLEVLFHVWTAKGSHQDGELRIVDWQGGPLASVPLPRNGETWSGALGAPTLANIDGDPALEVLSGTTGAGLIAHELPGTAGARVVWRTSRGDFTRAAPEPGATAAGLAALATLGWRRRRRDREAVSTRPRSAGVGAASRSARDRHARARASRERCGAAFEPRTQ